jgi:hypothetical protein
VTAVMAPFNLQQVVAEQVQNLVGSGQLTTKETAPVPMAVTKSGWFSIALKVYSTTLFASVEQEEAQVPVASCAFGPEIGEATTVQSRAKETVLALRAQVSAPAWTFGHPTPVTLAAAGAAPPP